MERREICVSYLCTDDVNVFQECDFISEMRPSKVEHVLLEDELEEQKRQNQKKKKELNKAE